MKQNVCLAFAILLNLPTLVTAQEQHSGSVFEGAILVRDREIIRAMSCANDTEAFQFSLFSQGDDTSHLLMQGEVPEEVNYSFGGGWVNVSANKAIMRIHAESVSIISDDGSSQVYECEHYDHLVRSISRMVSGSDHFGKLDTNVNTNNLIVHRCGETSDVSGIAVTDKGAYLLDSSQTHEVENFTIGQSGITIFSENIMIRISDDGASSFDIDGAPLTSTCENITPFVMETVLFLHELFPL